MHAGRAHFRHMQAWMYGESKHCFRAKLAESDENFMYGNWHSHNRRKWHSHKSQVICQTAFYAWGHQCPLLSLRWDAGWKRVGIGCSFSSRMRCQNKYPVTVGGIRKQIYRDRALYTEKGWHREPRSCSNFWKQYRNSLKPLEPNLKYNWCWFLCHTSHGHGHGIFILATHPEGIWTTNPMCLAYLVQHFQCRKWWNLCVVSIELESYFLSWQVVSPQWMIQKIA